MSPTNIERKKQVTPRNQHRERLQTEPYGCKKQLVLMLI